jgi:hypothetical protein
MNKTAQNDGATDINCIRFAAAPVRFRNRIQFASVPELRLCMAASRSAQHNKRANRTKRLSIKTIFRAAQISSLRAVDGRATFSLSRPISFKELGNS